MKGELWQQRVVYYLRRAVVLFPQAENGGLVMVSFYADLLTCTAVARMEDVMRK
jgi:hypothetical protein